MSLDQEHKPQATGEAGAPIQAKQANHQASFQRQSLNELGAVQRKTAGGPSARQQSLGEIGGAIQLREAGEAEQGAEQGAPQGAQQGADVQQTAQAGVAGPGQQMPHADRIQAAFGNHDLSKVKAHVGGDAAKANAALGAEAYATGDNIAFQKQPDLHTAAHEAAHVIQQRAGKVQPGLGAANDAHEQQADQVADKVVAGESAEGLLDASAGPEGANAGAAGGGAPVQRKLVDNVKATALAPVTTPLGKSEYPETSPAGGVEAFSGPKKATLVHKPSGHLGTDLQPIADKIGRAEHGMSQDIWVKKIPETNPEVMDKPAFSVGIGGTTSQGSFDVTNSPLTVRSYFRNVMYPLESGGPWTVSTSGEYKRNTENDQFAAWYHEGIGCNTISGTLSSGPQQLTTKHDGSLFGRWTSKETSIKNVFTDVLGSKSETDAFVAALQPTGVAGITGWYDHARRGGFNGKVGAWLDETMNKDDVQTNVLRSLQLLHKQGAVNANNDMDDIIDGMRAKMADKKTPDSVRIVLENRVLASGVAKNVKVNDTVVPSDGDKKPDTEDANFDRMRLAGKILARRELAPFIKAVFDPIAFAEAFPIETSHTLGADLRRHVLHGVDGLKARMSDFMANQLNDVTLDPGDNEAKTKGIDSDQRKVALGSARLGAVEGVREAAEKVAVGPRSICAHLGVHQGLLAVKNVQDKSFIGASVADSASTGMAEMVGKIPGDHDAITDEAARIGRVGAKETDKVRAENLRDFATSVTLKAIASDLADLRKEVKSKNIDATEGADKKAIKTTAYAHAINAKTEANVAYKSAHDRYRGDFLDNLNGKFDEKLGGPKWLAVGSMILNLTKESLDVRSAMKGLTGLGAAAGPALGVFLVTFDAILTIYDWWAKAKINKAKTKMTSQFKDAMKDGEEKQLAKIQANAETEVKLTAKGEVRPMEGMKAYADALAAGKESATPPKPIDIDDMERAELDAFYTNMLQNPGLPHDAIYRGYLVGIATKGNEMWKKFEQEIEALPNVTK